MIEMNKLGCDQDDEVALLIVPPFAAIDKPSLGAHILQSCARSAGFGVKILYANVILAANIGETLYSAICHDLAGFLLGERFFAAAAYGLPSFGSDNLIDRIEEINDHQVIKINPYELRISESLAPKWADNICDEILRYNFKIVGCTTSFQQTAASIALLKRVKRLRPDIVTIIGGANCEGEMAEGMLSLGSAIDYVFSGESEASFPKFLKDILEGNGASTRIIHGGACMNLDNIPTPNFSDFYKQIKSFQPEGSIYNSLYLSYESSRGCWRGQNHPCTFCGLTGKTRKYRKKSPQRVIDELRELLKNHPNNFVAMTDNIMPQDYFKNLIPFLSEKIPEINIFYEQRSNLSLEEVIALKKSGVGYIQAGIESLSTKCLALMNKGITAGQNLAILRYARSTNLNIAWNLLYDIPGDQIEEYVIMLNIIPFLYHLQPPKYLSKISVDRFSLYFNQPQKYGISNIRPAYAHFVTLPKDSNIAKIAYHFKADYESAFRESPSLFKRLEDEIKVWRSYWQPDSIPPILEVIDMGEENFLLLDTRRLPGIKPISFITPSQASVSLIGGKGFTSEQLKWGIERKVIIELDSEYVPLATSEPEILYKFEYE